MHIHRLEPQVIDQIAAGEVLERPANLIKELVENSLDARADVIEVFVDQGGRQVRIVDNGSGIAADELPLAIERHATSKIDKASDLWELASFGFRGEALASTAAVSRLTVTSRTKTESHASQLVTQFGDLADVLPVGRDVGTTVDVESLFENVPARLKFLKSDSAEITQIKKVLRALALAHPFVELRLHVGGDTVVWPKSSDHKSRAETVLSMYPLFESQLQESQGSVRVIFGSPNQVQKTSQNIWLFVNNRWVQDRSLQAAVLEAYRNLLMHGEFPIVVIHLEIPPELVDVNVHPSKSQVKFSDPRQIFRLVHGALRSGLEKAPWLPHVLAREEKILEIQPEPITATFFEGSAEPTQYQQKVWTVREQLETFRSPLVERPAPAVKSAESSGMLWSSLQVLGQAGHTYIIAQSARGLVFVDQHAAHERVAFEKLMKSWRESKPEVQTLLIPISLGFETSLCDAILSQAAELEKMGLSVERGGPETVFVTALPTLVKDSAIAPMLDRLAREVEDLGASFSFERKTADLFASMACHSVVRAGQALSIEEMQSLLNQMDEFPLSSFCPHGRPVFVEYSFRDLDSDFGRIV